MSNPPESRDYLRELYNLSHSAIAEHHENEHRRHKEALALDALIVVLIIVQIILACVR